MELLLRVKLLPAVHPLREIVVPVLLAVSARDWLRVADDDRTSPLLLPSTIFEPFDRPRPFLRVKLSLVFGGVARHRLSVQHPPDCILLRLRLHIVRRVPNRWNIDHVILDIERR